MKLIIICIIIINLLFANILNNLNFKDKRIISDVNGGNKQLNQVLNDGLGIYIYSNLRKPLVDTKEFNKLLSIYSKKIKSTKEDYNIFYEKLNENIKFKLKNKIWYKDNELKNDIMKSNINLSKSKLEKILGYEISDVESKLKEIKKGYKLQTRCNLDEKIISKDIKKIISIDSLICNNITVSDLKTMNIFKDLKVLGISGNITSDELNENLKNNKIKYLDISGTDISKSEILLSIEKIKDKTDQEITTNEIKEIEEILIFFIKISLNEIARSELNEARKYLSIANETEIFLKKYIDTSEYKTHLIFIEEKIKEIKEYNINKGILEKISILNEKLKKEEYEYIYEIINDIKILNKENIESEKTRVGDYIFKVENLLEYFVDLFHNEEIELSKEEENNEILEERINLKNKEFFLEKNKDKQDQIKEEIINLENKKQG
jgi:hypothetical protein